MSRIRCSVFTVFFWKSSIFWGNCKKLLWRRIWPFFLEKWVFLRTSIKTKAAYTLSKCVCAQLCTHSHWHPLATKRTGTSVFVVRSLRIFRHFQNFPGNSLFSGKIWPETRWCHRGARMSNHSRVRPQFWVKITPLEKSH